jgi:PAS domain S-box-containing protein
MKDSRKTKTQLIVELAATRQRIAELEKSEIKLKQDKEKLWKSEERYRVLLEHASDAIIIANSKGNFLEVNKKAEDLLGYTRKELVGMNPRHIHPEEELERIIRDFSMIAAGEINASYDTKVLRKDGRLVPVDITAAPVEYAGRTLVQGIFRDITERKGEEEKLEKFVLELQEAFTNIKGLGGVLPICSSCKKIRSDNNYWEQIETYITKHSGTGFSHGICPECAQKLYPEYIMKE